MILYKLTTNDNPFNPFEDFDKWFQFDTEKGYYSCSVLARIVNIQDDFSQVEINEEESRAIDQIIKYDFTDTFKKISKEFPDQEEEISLARVNLT